MPRLAIFTTPKPFTDADIARIQRNALRSWRTMGADVEILVIGDEPGAAEAAREVGAVFVPEVRRNRLGTPLISSIFDIARQLSDAPHLIYANADILLTRDLAAAVDETRSRFSSFLLVGRRWDLAVPDELVFEPDGDEALRRRVQLEGRLHGPTGSDYFAFPRGCFTSIPDFAVGRAGWDNWMLFEARRRRWPLVDATERVLAVHQEHDYRHLPGGQPHYRLPESDENVRLAGGGRAILTQADTDWVLGIKGPVRRGWSVRRGLREIELLPVLHFGSPLLAVLTYTLFHPRRAWGELRGWLAYKFGARPTASAGGRK